MKRAASIRIGRDRPDHPVSIVVARRCREIRRRRLGECRRWQKSQQTVRPRSFLVGTTAVLEGNDYDQTYDVTAAKAGTPWALTATGWLRGLYLLCTGTGLTAGTASADAPFNIFSNIQLDDVNNESIFGPFDGYTAFLTNKYGGYIFAGDPATSSVFALSGTTSTNNFTFVLYIPLEIVARGFMKVRSMCHSSLAWFCFTLHASRAMSLPSRLTLPIGSTRSCGTPLITGEGVTAPIDEAKS